MTEEIVDADDSFLFSARPVFLIFALFSFVHRFHLFSFLKTPGWGNLYFWIGASSFVTRGCSTPSVTQQS
jgi:hypothetical protein